MKELKQARDAAGLSQRNAADLLGVTDRTLSDWETKGTTEAKARNAIRTYSDYAAGKLKLLEGRVVAEDGSHYGQGDATAPRFPIAVLLRRPAVRIRLSEIRTELAKAEASPEQEENVMTLLNDRQRIAKFSGGSVDDEYTEADVLMAIDSIAEVAFRILSGPTL
jgi:transcriptional regulator with XRE-family HTH domain